MKDHPTDAPVTLAVARPTTGPAREAGRGSDGAGSPSVTLANIDDSASHSDPTLEGIPREVIENVGAYADDCAGGCG